MSKAAASDGGGVVIYWHPDSSEKWLLWLRLKPPKMAPFLAAPNKNRDAGPFGGKAIQSSLDAGRPLELRRCIVRDVIGSNP